MPKFNSIIEESSSSCVPVLPVQERMLNIYKGRLICIKRSDFNFFNSTRPKINGECPALYKSCGTDATPPSKIICVLESKQCPISSIKVVKQNSALDSNYETRDLDKGWMITFTRSSLNMLPIVNVKLTEGSPCINSYEIDMTKGRYLYPLSNTLNNLTYQYHGCQDSIKNEIFKSPGYEKIDQIDEKSLLEDNKVYQELKGLPSNQIDSTSPNYFYGLFEKSAIEFDLSCEYSNHGISVSEIKQNTWPSFLVSFGYDESIGTRIETWHLILNAVCLTSFIVCLVVFIPSVCLILTTKQLR